jgi:PAS domain S-box-containing protein
MYDYQEVLALLNRSDRFHEELERSFDRMSQSNGQGDKDDVSAQILTYLKEHFTHYNLNPMIVETDLDAVITFANKAFIEATGYTEDELIGQNINILKSSHMHPGIYTDIWNHLDAGKPWRGQLRNTTKNYESYWIDTVIAPVFNENGETVKYWSLSYDITEQIRIQEQLEAKNHELMDSLKYAKRIQRTILPGRKEMEKVLPEHFTIYKPKDIVSGDFYWFAATLDKIFVAAVDCTGHGVPGAFMSLIGFNLLNHIVIQRRIQNPGLILTELHKGVRQSLKQEAQDSRSRDGMDLSLVCIDRYEDRLQYAGAHNPLYWWSYAENDLKVVKGDKMAIGGEQMEEERIFTNHDLEIQENDCIYLFSDGFVDQFGGPEEKKFGTKRLKNLIRDYHDEEMKIQRANFNLVWKDWIDDREQIDDVTLIGIRLVDSSGLD